MHFIAIGAVIFLLASPGKNEQTVAPRDRIVITEGRLQQLVQIFMKTWQRPPTGQELRGLIDANVKEEVYFREALKLGLDRDDTVIRRRMQQKMEFLTEPSEDLLAASDADLKAYLAAHRTDFRVEATVAFEQIFIDPKASETTAAERAEKLKAIASQTTDVTSLGDPTLLPHAMPKMELSLIDRTFGKDFGRQLTALPLNTWHGPVRSSYGLHIVRVTERHESYDPPLAQVRTAVERKWRTAKRDAYQRAEYQRLRKKYDVILPQLEAATQAKKRLP